MSPKPPPVAPYAKNHRSPRKGDHRWQRCDPTVTSGELADPLATRTITPRPTNGPLGHAKYRVANIAMVYTVMARIILAYKLMDCIVMAYMVMAYIVMALYGYGPI